MVSHSRIVLTGRHRGRDYRLSAWFRDSGDELVLFVHGLGCSKESWRKAWSAPSLYGKSLLAIDLPGFGASARSADYSHDLEEQAGLLASIIDAHASRHLWVVAHSMGGSIATLLPPTVARRLDGLILVEARLLRASCSVSTLAAAVDAETFAADTFPKFRQRVALDRRAAFDLDRSDREAFYLCSRSLFEYTGGVGLVDQFAALECAGAFVYGADNGHLAELDRVEPQRLHEIPDAGHFVMNDNPDAFYALLAQLTGESE
jgi:pimeloyl-ACP methyl ester carboxylesterase